MESEIEIMQLIFNQSGPNKHNLFDERFMQRTCLSNVVNNFNFFSIFLPIFKYLFA